MCTFKHFTFTVYTQQPLYCHVCKIFQQLFIKVNLFGNDRQFNFSFGKYDQKNVIIIELPKLKMMVAGTIRFFYCFHETHLLFLFVFVNAKQSLTWRLSIRMLSKRPCSVLGAFLLFFSVMERYITSHQYMYMDDSFFQSQS